MSRVPADLIAVFVGQDLVGDGAMKLPFLRVLRQAYPGARILWAAEKKSVFASTLRPLVEDLLDEVVEDTGLGCSWNSVFRPAIALPRTDLLIDTQRRVATTLALRRLRARCFVSASAAWRLSDRRPPDRNKPPAMLAQMFRLLEACGIAPDLAALPPPSLPPALAVEVARRLPVGHPLVGLAPGAGDRQKCWPLHHFIAVGRALAVRGLKPVVVLGPNEQEWKERIQAELPEAVVPLSPDDSPLMTIAIAARLSVAVANDSGTGHLLAAGGTKMISLFGPTAPEKFAPASLGLVVIRAQDYGAAEMAAIPEQAVLSRIAEALRSGPFERRFASLQR